MSNFWDSFRIYSNDNVVGTISSMIKNGRLSHAFLLFGEKGLGKKTIAEHIAAQILCENGEGFPCGSCKSCRMIAHKNHPDVIHITHTAENKGFSVKNLREVCVDAYIAPNEGERKVYIFDDCDQMSVPAQNTLLKLIEEPPAHAFFIFTASSKTVFLPTIISRVISLGVNEVSLEECEKALLEKASDKSKISDAISAFGGNIGMCLEYISGEELPEAVRIAKNIADKLSESEYELLTAINELDGNKPLAKSVFRLLCGIIRDSSTVRLGSESLIGCYKEGSVRLSRTLSLRQANEIFRILTEASHRIDGNANLLVTLTSICADIKSLT